MKSAKSYLPAFTMMDVLTGMVVMSIVVVMVFYLISATTQQAHGFQKVRMELTSYLLMKADLKRQAELADRMEELPNGFKLVNAAGEIDYIQQDFLLLRQTEFSLDTVCKSLVSVKKIPVDTVTETNLPRLLAGIELKMQLETQVLTCYLYKSYGLTAPMNQQLVREF